MSQLEWRQQKTGEQRPKRNQVEEAGKDCILVLLRKMVSEFVTDRKDWSAGSG